MNKLLLILCLETGILFGCSNDSPKQQASLRETPVLPEEVPTFDGGQAYKFLIAQTDFGPRNPGSSGHENCLNYLQSEMKKYADAVNLQPFSYMGYDAKALSLTNIISSFNLRATTRILLIAHWDTRPRADNDKNPKKQALPILGANDGASGVAILLEIARHLRKNSPAVGVDMIFVDGEDYGREGDTQKYLLGSRYFVKNLPSGFAPAFGILLDMVGDKELEIGREKNSVRYAHDIVDLVWSAATELGVIQFSNSDVYAFDDHIPFNEMGIKTIDLIDFSYPDTSNRFWHSTEDTPDKCSAESLEAVGKVLMHVIYRQQNR